MVTKSLTLPLLLTRLVFGKRLPLCTSLSLYQAVRSSDAVRFISNLQTLSPNSQHSSPLAEICTQRPNPLPASLPTLPKRPPRFSSRRSPTSNGLVPHL